MLGRLCDMRVPRVLNRGTMVDDDDEFEAIRGARPRSWRYEFAHILLPRFLFERMPFFPR